MSRKPYKHVTVESIKKTLEITNDLLKSYITQSAKKDLCTMIENLLMDARAYGGYNNNYWLGTDLAGSGCKEWKAAGKPEGTEKMRYIIGHDAVASKSGDYFTHTVEGEYSRTYWYR